MDDAQRMLIERACERLVTEYCHFIDHGEAVRVGDLFVTDGVWAFGKDVRSGRDAILKGFQDRQDNAGRISRHICSNFLIDIIDKDSASGVVYFTLFRHDGEPGARFAPAQLPTSIGEYRDTFVRTADGWRIKRRDITVSFTMMRGQGS